MIITCGIPCAYVKERRRMMILEALRSRGYTDSLIWANVTLLSHHKILLKAHELAKCGIKTSEVITFQVVLRSGSGLQVADRIQWKDYLLGVVSNILPTPRPGYDTIYGCSIQENES